MGNSLNLLVSKQCFIWARIAMEGIPHAAVCTWRQVHTMSRPRNMNTFKILWIIIYESSINQKSLRKSMFFSVLNLPLNIHLFIQFRLFLSISKGTCHFQDQKIKPKQCHQSPDWKQLSEKNKINILVSPFGEENPLRLMLLLLCHILTTAFENYCPPLVRVKTNACFSN